MVNGKRQQATSQFRMGEPDMKRILAGFAVREQIIGLLVNAPRGDAIGACMAFLLQAAQVDPGQMRSVLESPVDTLGGDPRRMVDAITQLVK